MSDKTVRNHVSNVFAKLHVSDRAARSPRAATPASEPLRPPEPVQQGSD